jgi:glycosyltransferase involved in cell wall biosynthesis
MPYASASLLVIGPSPPPATGMELATQAMVQELQAAGVSIVRVNTADSKDALGNRGRWTLHNVILAVPHLAAVAYWSFSRTIGAVYVPIAQDFPALFRDLAFVIVARVAKKPVILHLHGGALDTFYESQSRPVRILLRRVLGTAKLGIVLSDELRPCLECVLAPERIVAVPNGIDFDPGRTVNHGDGGVNVLFLSTLFEWKGVLVFIEAFARARSQHPSLRATVAGRWPSSREHEASFELASRLGVTDAIQFVGSVEGVEKRKVFADADIFCFPSLVPEGHPLVIIEAMASALPVVAAAWPGVAAAVIDGETGLLVTAPTPDSIAERLVQLAERPEQREQLGREGRRRYEHLYTQDAFGERIIAALQPVLEQAGVCEIDHAERVRPIKQSTQPLRDDD